MKSRPAMLFKVHIVPLIAVLMLTAGCLTIFREKETSDGRAATDEVQPMTKQDDGAEMVSVPAGEFWMGSEDGLSYEKPRRVHVAAFSIDMYEVTNTLYARFAEATGRSMPSYWNESDWNASLQPVVVVDWDDAKAYCSWAGKRLPTEKEWEKAAKGTSGWNFPWGEEWDTDRANAQSKIGKTVRIGSYPRGESPYGVHDMGGNAAEWVADEWYDWLDVAFFGRAKRIIRGGSWIDHPHRLRTWHREGADPRLRSYYVGFRCAR